MGKVIKHIKQTHEIIYGSKEEDDFDEEFIRKNKGKCIYCEKCHPCPMKLDIARINELYDLAKDGNTGAKEDYASLEKLASSCMHCNHCNYACPFEVDMEKRMQEIAEFFGE